MRAVCASLHSPHSRLRINPLRCPSGNTPESWVNASRQKYSTLPKFGIVVCVGHPGVILRGDDPSSSSRAGERWTRQRRHEQAGRAGVSPVSPHLVGTNGAVRFVASSCRRQGAHSRRPLGRWRTIAYGKIVWSRRPRYCASSLRDDLAANRRSIDSSS